MDKELAQKFILDPEWLRMESYILSFFESETDVAQINTEMDSSAVHAEVIARKRIKENIDSLKASMDSMKTLHSQKPTSFK